MDDATKKILLKSVRILKSNGGLDNKDIKPVIMSLEKLYKKRRPNTRIKRA